MTEQSQPAIEPWGFLAPVPRAEIPAAPPPDDTWIFDGGTARVYYGSGNRGPVHPVVLSDGFSIGPTDHDLFWDSLERGPFPFASELRARGRDLVLVGYRERSRPVLDNARVAIECINRTIAERYGNAPLTVGGFSMGGVIMRYALAKMEHDRVDHQTDLYLSYDAPHRGAWIPIALQALAHFLIATPDLSQQINSPAARELLWRHLATPDGTPAEDPMRTRLLAELAKVGGWPVRPRRLGASNGGPFGNGVAPGVDALRVTTGWFTGTTLRTQSAGKDQEVALLKGACAAEAILTDGLPELDGAPGGTLESFGVIGRKMRLTGAVDLTPGTETVCFVPAVSALSVRDLEEDIAVDIDSLPPGESDFDEFTLSTANNPHAVMSRELGAWIVDRIG
ncbi:esterase/lipase family protein [Streptomyces sp. SBT349]|uniref:esterase/lipase family protein n=1 Tax=Streptomyces sp. SBT349 TaxID=1580539 RepID=UPI00066BC134|nr:hypothetical protein [Streptomyces sp. SBT349]